MISGLTLDGYIDIEYGSSSNASMNETVQRVCIALFVSKDYSNSNLGELLEFLSIENAPLVSPTVCIVTNTQDIKTTLSDTLRLYSVESTVILTDELHWRNVVIAVQSSRHDFILFWELDLTISKSIIDVFSLQISQPTVYLFTDNNFRALMPSLSIMQDKQIPGILALPTDLAKDLGGFNVSLSPEDQLYINELIVRASAISQVRIIQRLQDNHNFPTLQSDTDTLHIIKQGIANQIIKVPNQRDKAKNLICFWLPTSVSNTSLKRLAQKRIRQLIVKLREYTYANFSELVEVKKIPDKVEDGQTLILITYPYVLKEIEKYCSNPSSIKAIWAWESEPDEQIYTSVDVIKCETVDFCPLSLQFPHLFYSNFFRKREKKLKKPRYSIINESEILKNTTICAHLHCYDYEQFYEIYSPYLTILSSRCHIIVTFCKISQSITNSCWEFPYTLLFTENKGFDLGAKFAFIDYVKAKLQPFDTYIFLHSKSCPTARRRFFKFIYSLPKNISLKEGYHSGHTYEIKNCLRLCIQDKSKIPRTEVLNDGILDGARYFGQLESLNPKRLFFCEGNCFMIPANIAEIIYGDHDILALLNTPETFDFVWYSNIKRAENQCPLKVYQEFIENNGPGNILNPRASSLSVWRDGQIEHLLERLIYCLVDKWNYT